MTRARVLVDKRTRPLADRLRAKLAPNGDCLEWQGVRNAKGYGHISRGGTPRRVVLMYAHRAAWEIANGPLPDGACVLHRCDNPPCCNPDHLFLGTRSVNHADMVAKDRHGKGSRNGMARLTEADVRRIHALDGEGVSRQEIAAQFDTKANHVSRILNGTRWGHVVRGTGSGA